MARCLTFADGFREAYLTAKGKNAKLPPIPVQPEIPPGKTPYQVGLLKGMEYAQRR